MFPACDEAAPVGDPAFPPRTDAGRERSRIGVPSPPRRSCRLSISTTIRIERRRSRRCGRACPGWVSGPGLAHPSASTWLLSRRGTVLTTITSTGCSLATATDRRGRWCSVEGRHDHRDGAGTIGGARRPSAPAGARCRPPVSDCNDDHHTSRRQTGHRRSQLHSARRQHGATATTPADLPMTNWVGCAEKSAVAPTPGSRLEPHSLAHICGMIRSTGREGLRAIPPGVVQEHDAPLPRRMSWRRWRPPPALPVIAVDVDQCRYVPSCRAVDDAVPVVVTADASRSRAAESCLSRPLHGEGHFRPGELLSTVSADVAQAGWVNCSGRSRSRISGLRTILVWDPGSRSRRTSRCGTCQPAVCGVTPDRVRRRRRARRLGGICSE